MSVDTYLKGKNLSSYRIIRLDGVKVLLSPKLLQWGSHVRLDVRSRALRRPALVVDVDHEHGPGCSH